jgi:hypothetical protein
MTKTIFILLRLSPMALLLFLMTRFALEPSVDVKCSRNSAKAAVCQVIESQLFLQQKRNFYPISATYDGTYHSSSKSGNYTSYRTILLDESGQQLRVGESSKDKSSVEATVAKASAFLTAKSPSYEWQDDPGMKRWFFVGFMGLMVMMIARDIWQAVTALPAEKNDVAQA